MPPLMPTEAFTGPSPAGPVMVVIDVAVAVVCVVVLVRLYRSRSLDERIRTRRGVCADGSTAAVGGAGAAHSDGGFDGDGFDGGGGGGGGEC